MLSCNHCKRIFNTNDKIMSLIPGTYYDDDDIIDSKPSDITYCCERCWEEVMFFLLLNGYFEA